MRTKRKAEILDLRQCLLNFFLLFPCRSREVSRSATADMRSLPNGYYCRNIEHRLRYSIDWNGVWIDFIVIAERSFEQRSICWWVWISFNGFSLKIISIIPGIVVSSFFWGFLADWEHGGRKKVMHWCTAIAFTFSVLSSFSVEVWMLVATRFFVGFLWVHF